ESLKIGPPRPDGLGQGGAQTRRRAPGQRVAVRRIWWLELDSLDRKSFRVVEHLTIVTVGLCWNNFATAMAALKQQHGDLKAVLAPFSLEAVSEMHNKRSEP